MTNEYPRPAHIGTPMLGDSSVLMREKGGPILEHLVSKARSIVGLGLFVARGTHPDGLFAGVTISQHIVNNLTSYVWECLLRRAYYLTTTMHLCLILRPPHLVDGFLVFSANSDSSCINGAVGDGGGLSEVPVMADGVSAASMGGVLYLLR